MATPTFFNTYSFDLFSGLHDWSSDTFKLYLSDGAPSTSDTNDASLPTEVANGNGYVTGGVTLDNVTLAQVGNDARVTIDDEVIQASGGSIGPFRYITLINSTSDRVVCFYDYGSSLTLSDGSSLTVDFDATNGVINGTVT